MRRFLPDAFTQALMAVVLLASLLPVSGQAAVVFDWVTNLAIGLLFFLHGAKLSREQIIAGAGHWRLHLLVFACTFIAFPLLGLALKPLLAPLTGDALYVGKGAQEVVFASVDTTKPAKFYYNCAPAHTTYPTKKVTPDDVSPVTLGDNLTSNRRTINKYFVPDVLETCQLSMGLTELAPGNLWNTMPCHTHERRMEVYFYFNMDEDACVFHMMGQPQETRHIVMHNEQAVISPSWSIHSGVGTKAYTFIWGMVGENQVFDDMDHVAVKDLR